MKKFLLSFAVVLMIVIFPVKKAAALVPSTYIAERDTVIWKINDVPVGRFPIVCAAEVYSMSENFNKLYEAGFKLADLSVNKSDGRWSLFIGKNKIFTVSEAHAESLKQDPENIALNLMSRIYEVLGAQSADKLTSKHKISGKLVTSGSVSWFGGKFIGGKFANGERYTATHLAAASKTLPFGTLIKVTVPSGKSVVVRVTDRFRGYKGRILDISQAAADILEIRKIGVPKAKIEVIGRADTICGK